MKPSNLSNNKNLFILNERKNLYYLLRNNFPNASKDDIEDVIQTTLIKAIKFYDPKKNKKLTSYLMTIANNCYIDIVRKSYKKNEKSLSDFSLYESFFVDEDFSETFCYQDYHKNIVQKLLSGLEDDKNVKAFCLHNFEDKNYEEIAIIENITNANVRKRIQRARQLLQKKYQSIVEEQ
jgi:RNA polymerase sigma factor (sigma-70 family)